MAEKRRAKQTQPCLTPSGFTLVEVIVSMVLISVLAAGIFVTISQNKRVSMRLQQKAIAAALVDQRMNELKRFGARDLTVTGPPASGANAACISSDCVQISELANGFRNTAITSPEPGNERIKEALVRVDWTDPRGAVMTESAVTYLYDV